MGFEPHSVAGSALNLASQLPLRGHAPFGIPCRGSQMQIGLTSHVLVWSGRWDLNPRQLAWEARTLPLSYARSLNRILRWLRSQVNQTGETLSALAPRTSP